MRFNVFMAVKKEMVGVIIENRNIGVECNGKTKCRVFCL